MKNSKRKNQSMIFDIFVIVLSLAMIPATIISYALWLKLIVCFVITGLNCLSVYLSYRNYKSYQKFLEEEYKKAEENKKKNMSLLDAYGILGISPQYNSDGSIKDIFSLLKIKPQYDDKGNRLLTIYEMLGINPMFTQLGIEIPFVFRIKNRARALVKAAAGTAPLIYVPRRSHMRGVEPLVPVVGPAKPGEIKIAPKVVAPIKLQPGFKKGPAKNSAGKAKYPSAQKRDSKIQKSAGNTSKPTKGPSIPKGTPSVFDAKDKNDTNASKQNKDFSTYINLTSAGELKKNAPPSEAHKTQHNLPQQSTVTTPTNDKNSEHLYDDLRVAEGTAQMVKEEERTMVINNSVKGKSYINEVNAREFEAPQTYQEQSEKE